MNYSYTQITYAGLLFDTAYVAENDSCWITMASVAKSIGCSWQNSRDWLARHSKQNQFLEIRVGVRNKLTKAYPVEVISEFIQYRANLGDKQCQALQMAVMKSDMERSIKHSFGQSTSESEHEQNRYESRVKYLNQLHDQSYEPGEWSKEYDKLIPNYLTTEQLIDMGITDKAEQSYMKHLAYVKERRIRTKNWGLQKKKLKKTKEKFNNH